MNYDWWNIKWNTRNETENFYSLICFYCCLQFNWLGKHDDIIFGKFINQFRSNQQKERVIGEKIKASIESGHPEVRGERKYYLKALMNSTDNSFALMKHKLTYFSEWSAPTQTKT